MMRHLLCRLGFHAPVGYVTFSFASYAECASCFRRLS